MAKRIENLGLDDVDLGAVELTPAEFEQFINAMERNGIPDEVRVATRNAGFAVPLTRRADTEWGFQFCQMPSDVKSLGICREGSLVDMKLFIEVMVRVGEWPEIPN